MNGIHPISRTAPRPVAPLSMIAEQLETLLAAARRMPDLDAKFLCLLEQSAALASGLEPYLSECTTPESLALQRLAAETCREDWRQRFQSGETALELEQEMVSGHIEGQFLKLLVHAMQGRRILEVGLFTGYSALAMAEALPNDGRLTACEIDPYAARFARRAFDASPHGHKIEIMVGDAAESIRQLDANEERFDMIFIDADKTSYPQYIRLILDGMLLAPHGIVCIDNTLLQGLPYLPGESTAGGRAVAECNRFLRDDPRVEQVLLPLRDGLTLFRRV